MWSGYAIELHDGLDVCLGGATDCYLFSLNWGYGGKESFGNFDYLGRGNRLLRRKTFGFDPAPLFGGTTFPEKW